MTKSGKNTNPTDTADTSKQASITALALTAQTIQPTMKFDSALQHILDIVIELRPEHCIRLCFDNDDICTLQEMLFLQKDDILELEYKDENGDVLPIKKHTIGLILSVQRLLHFLSVNGAAIYKDWGSISRDDFTSFQVSPLNSEKPIPQVKQILIAGITIDHTYNTKPIINSTRYNDPIKEF